LANSIITQNGTASITVTGRFGLNTANIANRLFIISGILSGSSHGGFEVSPTFGSGSTGSGTSLLSMITVNNAISLSETIKFSAQPTTFNGTGTTVNDIGFDAVMPFNALITGYQAAYRSQLGAGATRWGLYFVGTAQNYLNGNLLIKTLTNAENRDLVVVGQAILGGASTNNVRINTTGASLLELTSTTQGLLLPRMTTTQINAIVSPPDGLIAYNTTIAHGVIRQGGTWVRFNNSPM
jgi:hypothetical protein